MSNRFSFTKQFKHKMASRRRDNKGFTMVELMVSLLVLAILLGCVAIGIISWVKRAEYLKCNEYAKTVYTSSAMYLSNLELNDELELTMERMEKTYPHHKLSNILGTTYYPTGVDATNLYYIQTKAGDYERYTKGIAYDTDRGQNLVFEMLEPYCYDREILNHNITLEIDARSGEIYSAFVSSYAKELNYTVGANASASDFDEHGVVSMNATGVFTTSRSDGTRSELVLGYFSSGSIGEMADLEHKTLRVSNLELVNDETLELIFSSNSDYNNLDVKFTTTFYEKNPSGDKELFKVSVSLLEMIENHSYVFSGQNTYRLIPLSTTVAGATEKYAFPIYYDATGNFHLAVDAVTGAKAAYLAGLSEGEARVHATNITRLLEKAGASGVAPDIYATVGVAQLSVPEAQLIVGSGYDSHVIKNYLESATYLSTSSIESNIENALFDTYTASTGLTNPHQAELTKVRHLANIRYYNKTSEKTDFIVKKDLDFLATPVFDLSQKYSGAFMELEESEKQFPSIPKLHTDWSLTGEKLLGDSYYIQNLVLGANSVYTPAGGGSANEATSVALILDNVGAIHELQFAGAKVLVNVEEQTAPVDATLTHVIKAQLSKVQKIALLCANNEGRIDGIRTNNCQIYGFMDAQSGTSQGIGMICGVQHVANAEATMKRIRSAGDIYGEIYDGNSGMSVAALATAGKTYETLLSEESAPERADDEPIDAVNYLARVQSETVTRGIGGISGLTYVSGNVTAYGTDLSIFEQIVDQFLSLIGRSLEKSILNDVNVNGNGFTGGITGNLVCTTTLNPNKAQLLHCQNRGLVLSTRYSKRDDSFNGCFIGGCIGLMTDGKIEYCVDAAGTNGSSRAASFGDATVVSEATTETVAHRALVQSARGSFVGGIAGAVDQGVLRSCETRNGGYVVGYDYVGGITGALTKVTDGTSDTRLDISNEELDDSRGLTNASYVVGHSNVGGIVGANQMGGLIHNCLNNGVIAGYGKNIGGIAGCSVGNADSYATVLDCNSYIYDYNNRIHDLVTGVWQVYGTNVGGVVGFQSYGQVVADKKADDKITISSIVVGKDNVGGVVGLNGTQGLIYVAQISAEGTSLDTIRSGAVTEADKLDLKQGFLIEGGQVYATGEGVGGYIGTNQENEVFYRPGGSGTYELSMRPYLVTGSEKVGGVIGYNNVKLNDNITIALSNENLHGVVTGEKYVGGAVGYLRVTNNRVLTVTGENQAKVQADRFGAGLVGGVDADSYVTLKDMENYGSIEALNRSFETIYDADNQPVQASFVAGIVGASEQYTNVLDCINYGAVIADSGTGGIAAYNKGTIEHCTNECNLGTSDSSLLGGIVAVNDGSENDSGQRAIVNDCTMGSSTVRYTILGKDSLGGISGYNLSNSYIKNSNNYADIAGEADGTHIGGLIGYNCATEDADAAEEGVYVGDSFGFAILGNVQYISGGEAVGGLVGTNAGRIVIGSEIAVSSLATVDGVSKVGGVVGVQRKHATIATTSEAGKYINYAPVTAESGEAGGIAGVLSNGGLLEKAINYGYVHSLGSNESRGYAGGITASVEKGAKVKNCLNRADVTSEQSYAAGVAAYNNGTITSTKVKNQDEQLLTITSDAPYMGIFIAYNDAEGMLKNCQIIDSAGKLHMVGTAEAIGGLCGLNKGQIVDDRASAEPDEEFEHSYTLSGAFTYDTTKTEGVLLGGICGRNEHVIEGATVSRCDFTAFDEVQYLGGIAGRNLGQIIACVYEDSEILQTTTAKVSNCYGGITGCNGYFADEEVPDDSDSSDANAQIEQCSVKSVRMNIEGCYKANNSQSASEKEALVCYVGGITGKNEINAVIMDSTLDDSEGYERNQIKVANGMIGGITGFNKGLLSGCGYASEESWDSAVAIKEKVERAYQDYLEELEHRSASIRSHVDAATNAEKVALDAMLQTQAVKAMAADTTVNKAVAYDMSKTVPEQKYAGSNETVANHARLLLQISNNGNIGGITGYNAPTGEIEYSVTGQWLIYNSCKTQYAACGGVIGMNESEKDTRFLVNRAFIGREVRKEDVPGSSTNRGVTNRFAGGIIGNQSNTTTSNWKIYGCINYGTVYNLRSHYSGGIIGRWSDNGGLIEYCRNYGRLQTSWAEDWRGASAGMVAQLYHPTDYHSFNILSCRNDGSISMNNTIGANDSAGILGNVTTYSTEGGRAGQVIDINVVDCVNGAGVQIDSASMSAGMICFLSSDNPSDHAAAENIQIRIDRCRNYGVMNGSRYNAGMFGDRYSGWNKTAITNCVNYGKTGWVLRGQYSSQILYGGSSNDPINNMGINSENCFNNYYFDGTANGHLSDYVANREQGSHYCYSVDGNSTMLYIHLWQEDNQVFCDANQLLVNVDINSDRYCQYRVEYMLEGSSTFLFAQAGVDTNIGETSRTIVIDGIPEGARVSTVRVELAARGYASGTSQNKKEGIYSNETNRKATVASVRFKGSEVYKHNWKTGYTGTRIDTAGGDYQRTGNTTRLFVWANSDGKYYLVSSTPEVDNGSSNVTSGDYEYRRGKLIRVTGSSGYQIGTVLTELTEEQVKAFESTGDFKEELVETALDNYYKNNIGYNEGLTYPEAVSAESHEKPTVTTIMKDGASTGWMQFDFHATRMRAKYYLVTIYDENGAIIEKDWKCFSTSATYPISEAIAGKKIYIGVRAVGDGKNTADGDAAVSDEVRSDTLEIRELAPTPEMRAELVPSGDGYRYEYTVTKESLDKLNEAGVEWKVQFFFQGEENEVYELNASNVQVPAPNTSAEQKRIYAQSVVDGMAPSGQFSAQMYMPPKTPNYTLQSPNVELKGESVADIEILASLGCDVVDTGKDLGILPIYRVELIGAEELVIDYQDVVLSTDETTVKFNNFTDKQLEALREATDASSLKLRVWYAQSGLGPVYTWHEESDEAQANVTLLEEDTKRYLYSTVLAGADSFAGYHTSKEIALSLGDAPTLKKPAYRTEAYENGDLIYDFEFEPGATTNRIGYELRIIGHKTDAEGEILSDVLLYKEKTYDTTIKQLSLDADDWNYDKVTVRVADLCNNGVIGNYTEKTYDILQRIPRITQLSVSLLNRNDQNYQVQWREVADKYRDELRCYDIYVEIEEADTPQIKKLTSIEDTNRTTVNLERYAGKTVSLYVVARVVDESEDYLDSVKGLAKTVTVKERFAIPSIVGEYYWKTTRDSEVVAGEYVTESEFTSSDLRLVVPMEKKITGSYLMNGFVFATEAEARQMVSTFAAEGDMANTYTRILQEFTTGHCLATVETPIVMTHIRKKDGAQWYQAAMTMNDIRYAGYYVVPVMRGTSNTEISSYWTWNQSGDAVIRLPKVQLNAPALTDSSTEIIAVGEKSGVYSYTDGFDESYPFHSMITEQNSYFFEATDYAAAYEVALTDGTSTWNLMIQGNTVTMNGVTRSFVDGMVDYSDEIYQELTGPYRYQGKVRYYKVALGARIKKEENGYSIVLPQTSQVITFDGNDVRVNNAKEYITKVTARAVALDTSRYSSSDKTEK